MKVLLIEDDEMLAEAVAQILIRNHYSFVVTDPLPAVQLEANGEPMYFMIDTGAGETYLDHAAAQALGVGAVATDVGEYAGGVSVETQYGILDSLQLGGVTLGSIPVNIADVGGQFSADYDLEISGIIGTGVFSQFLTTMDYINGARILQPKGQHAQTESAVSEVPFLKATTLQADWGVRIFLWATSPQILMKWGGCPQSMT
ncbi:MAG: aspartyl protease family protein [Oscillospiraceae bacterium]|nr:aspartyl protease family protein [Oscillospiraceae bacterium]